MNPIRKTKNKKTAKKCEKAIHKAQMGEESLICENQPLTEKEKNSLKALHKDMETKKHKEHSKRSRRANPTEDATSPHYTHTNPKQGSWKIIERMNRAKK